MARSGSGPRKPRAPTDSESELFAKVVAGAKPLRKRPGMPPAVLEALSQPRKFIPQIRPITHPPIEDRPAPAIQARDRAAISAMDGRNAERLIKGRLEIEARLDLHGHRQDMAQRELVDFIRRNHSYGKRCVLVITGKGRSRKNRAEAEPAETGRYIIPERNGVLFDLVPEWLAGRELAPYVVAFSPAQPKHGGSGALYVYLRRERG
ncbi:MAG TPA: Smr/MutS family protein [Alphaproteobacteria bacterium]|nr:Smr/MutS family protein [Alphaproteobacteria bacterium]